MPKCSMKKGGLVPQTGIYRLHRGEKVIPAKRVRAAMTKKVTRGRYAKYSNRQTGSKKA